MGRTPSGSARKRASGKWQARFTGPDGVRRTATETFTDGAGRAWSYQLTFDTKDAAEEWLAVNARARRNGTWTPPPPLHPKGHPAAEDAGPGPARRVRRRMGRQPQGEGPAVGGPHPERL